MPLGNSKGSKQAPSTPKAMTYGTFKMTQMGKTTRKHILISLQGDTSTLKTSFALTAPSPIAMFDFDDGMEYVKDRYVDDKEIYRIGDSGDGINQLSLIPSEDKAERQQQAERVWGMFKQSYYSILDDPKFKTIVIDTATHMWDIAQWAIMGRITMEREAEGKDTLPFHYSIVNAQVKSLFSQAKRSKKHVIFCHHEKEVWTGDGKPSGKMTLHGWKHGPKAVELSLRTSVFGIGKNATPQFTILKDRITKAPGIPKTGHTYSGYDQCNFAYIAHNITGTDIEEWR